MGFNNENSAMNDVPDPMWMAFDIETCPMPTCEEYLVEPIEAPANYKDPAKIAAYISDKKQAQIAQAALDLDLCEVVAIGGEFADSSWTQTRETNSEDEMLRGFWRFVSNVQRNNGFIIGFNCLSFDLPILLRRSLYLGIETPRVPVDKYRHDGVVDLADLLSFSGKTKWRSLSFYAKRFGIPHDNSIDGSQIPQLVADGKWLDIASHVRADVATTTLLAKRMRVIHAIQQQTVGAV